MNENQSGNNDDTPVNKQYVNGFPLCLLVISARLSPSSSSLKVNGLCGIRQESSEFSLASPTECVYKFEICEPTEPHVEKKSKL